MRGRILSIKKAMLFLHNHTAQWVRSAECPNTALYLCISLCSGYQYQMKPKSTIVVPPRHHNLDPCFLFLLAQSKSFAAPTPAWNLGGQGWPNVNNNNWQIYRRIGWKIFARTSWPGDFWSHYLATKGKSPWWSPSNPCDLCCEQGRIDCRSWSHTKHNQRGPGEPSNVVRLRLQLPIPSPWRCPPSSSTVLFSDHKEAPHLPLHTSSLSLSDSLNPSLSCLTIRPSLAAPRWQTGPSMYETL